MIGRCIYDVLYTKSSSLFPVTEHMISTHVYWSYQVTSLHAA